MAQSQLGIDDPGLGLEGSNACVGLGFEVEVSTRGALDGGGSEHPAWWGCKGEHAESLGGEHPRECGFLASGGSMIWKRTVSQVRHIQCTYLVPLRLRLVHKTLYVVNQTLDFTYVSYLW